MDNAKNMHDEEEFHWTKGLIFTAIVLFPLIPFVLIYRHKFTRKTKIILMIDIPSKRQTHNYECQLSFI